MALIDSVKFVEVIPCPAAGDAYAGDTNGDVINMENFSEVTFIHYRGAGGTGTSDITVESCEDAAATGATTIAFEYKLVTTGTSAHTEGAWTNAAAAGFTTATTANVIYLVRINAADLDGTDKFVRFVADENADDPVGGATIAMLSGNRYPQEQLAASAIA